MRKCVAEGRKFNQNFCVNFLKKINVYRNNISVPNLYYYKCFNFALNFQKLNSPTVSHYI